MMDVRCKHPKTALVSKTAVAVAAALALLLSAQGQGAPMVAGNGAGDANPIQALHVQGNVWLMQGEPDSSNVTVQVGPDGVLVVDTGVTALASQLLDAINTLARAQGLESKKPISIIIDTGEALDHIGGNAVLREGGGTVLGGNFANDPNFNPGAPVWADEHVQQRMILPGADGKQSVDNALWPTQTRTEDLYSVMYDGEPVQLIHAHQTVTDGTTMVLFRGSNVIATGDNLSMKSYPMIDLKRGGTIDGELVALNRLLEMAVPGPYEEGGTLLIPGHGHICDQGDLVAYRNMITQIRNRIQYYKSHGKTLEQVIALKPTADTDYRWGSEQGSSTPRQFIEAVYATLPAKGGNFSMQAQFVVPADNGGRSHETF